MKRSIAVVLSAVLAVAACQSAATPSPLPSAPPSASNPVISPSPSTSGSPSVAPPTTAPSSTSQSSGTWQLAEAPQLDYYGGLSAVALGDGRVLFISDAVEGPLSTQLWDPANDAWQSAEPLPKYRSNFVAVSLHDGRALITGGLNGDGQAYSSTYLFDPRTETWSKSGLLGTARTNTVGVVLKDGRVLVAGGHYQNNPVTGSSEPEIILAAFRPSGQLADVDMPIFTAGLATAEVFDPATGTWSSIRPMTFARTGPDAVTLADGRVLVFGSEASWNTGAAVDDRVYGTAEIYDPTTDRWTMTGPLPELDRAGLTARGPAGANPIPDYPPLIDHGSLVALPNGDALLIGLAESWKHVGDLSRSFRYDAASNTWAEIGDTFIWVGEPTGQPLYIENVPSLMGSVAAPLPDGRTLVAGGGMPPNPVPLQDGNVTWSNDDSKAAWHVDAASNTWSDAPAMPMPRRNGHAIVLRDGSVLIYGGSTQEGGEEDPVPTVVRFIP